MRSTFAKGHFRKMTEPECGNSSVGRARPCQGRGREFESRFPLQIFRHKSHLSSPDEYRSCKSCSGIVWKGENTRDLAGWQSGHAADCNSVYAGSIPTPASIISTKSISKCLGEVSVFCKAIALLRSRTTTIYDRWPGRSCSSEQPC